MNLYKFKADLGATEIKKDIKDWGKEWASNKKLSEFLNSTTAFLSRMKPSYTISRYYPRVFNQMVPSFHGTYKLSDMVYSTDSMLLMESLPEKDFEKNIDYLLKEIQEEEGSNFSWPRNTLKKKSGTQISKLCLLAMTARNFGYDPFLIRESNAVFLIKDGACYLIDKDGLKSISFEESKAFLKDKTIKYFDYPQGFFFKNEYLAYVLHHAGATPQYCRNPASCFK